MKEKGDQEAIRRNFKIRQDRQILAIALAMFIVMLCAVLYKRPVFFEKFSQGTLFMVESVTIAAFVGFTAMNWRCPACKKYLGSDIHRQGCRKCGRRLQ